MSAARKTSRSCYKKGQKLERKSSNVDETLFGPPARLKMMTGNRTWTSSSTTEGLIKSSPLGHNTFEKESTSKDKMVEVVTKDLIRTLKIPTTPDPSGASIILSNRDFDDLKLRSMILSPGDRKRVEEERKAQRLKRMEESNTRKKQMQDYELERKKNEKPSDLEQDAIKKGSELVSRAKLQLEEQDDEIKQLNEVILNAKCHAIRDAQLEEKDEIKKAMEDEEKRLDIMMEVERQKALLESEEREKQRHVQRLEGAKVIHQQIEERELQRQLDAERRDQETQQLLKYMERLQQEDWDRLQKKKLTQKSLMEEVTKCNEEIQRQKSLVKEQEKLEELRILEYVKEKEKREEELQQEQERLKIEKEKEVARLRAQQERAKDKQAERDALRAKRNQEQFEREWRRKQKEEAEKKAETEANLRKAREEQVQHKDHFLAVQAQRERAEFERVLKKQKDLMLQDEKSQTLAAERRKTHALEVRKQISEKEEEIRSKRRAFFDEGIKLDKEAQERHAKLSEIKQRKLAELKEAGIPDKYCAEVSRRITAPPPSFIAH